jgi:formate hydrogenlyase transcriptional activator
LCEGETFAIDESWLKTGSRQPSTRAGSQVTTLVEGEKAMIEAALAEAKGRVSGPNGAAAKLGIPRQTLQSKIKALHIDKLAFQR